jgi:ESS family glutamate:Na+ symporter
MENFWDYKVWGTINLIAVLLLSLLTANMLKRKIKFLEKSLIPTSVLGGTILLVIAGFYDLVAKTPMFETKFFAENGYNTLEIITYHTLALGFIASTFKSSKGKLSPQRASEIFNTGVTTVSTYLLQGFVGMGITILAAMMIKGFFPASGLLVAFGFGQGTGQAMNYGNIYELEHGFVGGKTFGLTIAAVGFLCASFGGVIHLQILKRKKKKIINNVSESEELAMADIIQEKNEIPMQGSMDKMTFEIAFVMIAYLITYLIIFWLGVLLPGMRSVIYGFNFLIGVLSAMLIKQVLKLLKKFSISKREYINDFLMTRVSNFFFDLMVVAGIAAIRLGVLKNYWGIMIILGVAGFIITYFYNRIVAKTLFPAYCEEQFMMMYGMLTGTASTGTILLREIDGEFKTPASDNMVYQNFPAIVFGFPMMFLATLAPAKPYLVLIIFILFFAAMNVLLFRSKIFKKKTKK